MAEGLFRDATKKRKDIEVASAGVGTVYGQPPSAHSVEVLRPLGIDISKIRSQPLTEELVNWATHIFVMTRGHLDTIELVFPKPLKRLISSANSTISSAPLPGYSRPDRPRHPGVLRHPGDADESPSEPSPVYRL